MRKTVRIYLASVDPPEDPFEDMTEEEIAEHKVRCLDAMDEEQQEDYR